MERDRTLEFELAIRKLLDAYIRVGERAGARFTELAIWVLLALAPPGFYLKIDIRSSENFMKAFADHPLWGMYSIALLILPLASLLVFGGMPFELSRRRLTHDRKIAEAIQKIVSGSTSDSEKKASLLTALNASAVTSIELSRHFDPRELLSYYAQRSYDVSNDIYRRSSVYIFVGVIIATSGLAFFYLRSIDTPVGGDFLEKIINLAPNVGVLFFIELLAFYFLRQHRVAMDEFRYFESIKRTREENLMILKMYKENDNIVSTKEVLDAMTIYSSPAYLSKDNTTEMIELRKTLRDELNIFEKLIDTASVVLKKDKS